MFFVILLSIDNKNIVLMDFVVYGQQKSVKAPSKNPSKRHYIPS